MNQIPLKDKLLSWNEKQVDFLIDIYNANLKNSSFIRDIVQIYSSSDELEHSTSWIIKYHVENGHTLKSDHLEKILSKINKLNHWGSQLHVLQIISKISLTKEQAQFIEPCIIELLQSENKFVRAAAYEAYFKIVQLFPNRSNKFRTTCEEALDKESAAVKVKIKRILTQL